MRGSNILPRVEGYSPAATRGNFCGREERLIKGRRGAAERARDRSAAKDGTRRGVRVSFPLRNDLLRVECIAR